MFTETIFTRETGIFPVNFFFREINICCSIIAKIKNFTITWSQVLGRTPNWQDRELWFSISNDRWELLTLKYKAQPQDVLVFPFLPLVLGIKICYSFYLFAFVFLP